ncbi:hypothetical protein Tco_1093546 [Tanacetum coccineum]|uniref:Uncharacterized protein n=1 Tax=Tanacetum coccineum TaxID=301880 RepID=A0ABQ5ID11_9ASTR
MINTPYPEKTNTPYWKYRREHAKAKANGDLIIVFAAGFDRRNSWFTCEALAGESYSAGHRSSVSAHPLSTTGTNAGAQSQAFGAACQRKNVQADRFNLKAYTAFSDWKVAIYWVVEGLEVLFLNYTVLAYFSNSMATIQLACGEQIQIAMDKDSSTIREILSLTVSENILVFLYLLMLRAAGFDVVCRNSVLYSICTNSTSSDVNVVCRNLIGSQVYIN